MNARPSWRMLMPCIAFVLLPAAGAAIAPREESPTWQIAASAPVARGLLGSKHDFAPPDAPAAEHCVACHGRGAPMAAWRSQSSAAESAPVVPAATSQPNQAGRAAVRRQFSRRGSQSTYLCLTCHDGLLADDMSGGLRRGRIQGPAVTLHRDHPVGVRYPRNDRGYQPASRVERNGVPLPNGRVECVSCHDPHNAQGLPGMLNRNDRRSGLCLTCHVK